MAVKPQFVGRMRVVYGDIGAVGKTVEGALSLAVRKLTADAETNAKALIIQYNAVDTGTMLNSTRGTILSALHGQLIVGVAYGVYVNNGTYRMPPRPFFDRTVDLVKRELPDVVAAAIRSAL